MPATNWTPQSVNPTGYTPQTINPTSWTPGDPFTPSGILLLQDSVSYLLLQNSIDTIGLQ